MKNVNRNQIFVFVLVVLVGTDLTSSNVVAGPPGNPEEIQGRWQLISRTFRGKSLPFEGGMLEIAGDNYKLTTKIKLEDRRIIVDTSRTPATIDQIVGEGTDYEQKLLGVFEVTDSTLIICLADHGSPDRPTTTQLIPGSGGTRIERKRLDPPPPSGSSTSRKLEGEWLLVNIQSDGQFQPSRINRSDENVLIIKNGRVGGRATVVTRLKIKLHERSARAVLMDNEQLWRRCLVDLDPSRQELRVCQNLLSDDNFPSDLISTPENKATLYVFRKTQ